MAGTRWVRLDCDYFGNPKILGVSPLARLLHIAAICYSGGQLTDGVISRAAMRRLHVETGTTRRHLTELIDAYLIYEVDDEYLLHDFTAMQSTRAEVEARNRKNAERQAAWRAGRGG